MNKRIKRVLFGCLSFAIVSTAMIGCTQKDKDIEEKKPNQIDKKQELVYIAEDGTKVNQSDKIVKETKRRGDLEFKNISITESGNLTRIECQIYNSSNEILDEKNFEIVLLNNENEEVKRIRKMYVGTVLPGETKSWGTETTLDYSEVYDIKFVEENN